MLSDYITVAQNWNAAASWSTILSLPHLALYFLWVRFSFFLTIVAELFKYLVSQVLKAGRPACSLHVVRPKPSRKGASKISSIREAAGGCSAPSSIPSGSQPLWPQPEGALAHHIVMQVSNHRDDNGLNHWALALRTGGYQGHSLLLTAIISVVREQVYSPPLQNKPLLKQF